MLLKNLSTESGLVNGSRGTVIDFERSDGRSTHYPWLPIVKFQVLIGTDRSEHIVTLKDYSYSYGFSDSAPDILNYPKKKKPAEDSSPTGFMFCFCM